MYIDFAELLFKTIFEFRKDRQDDKFCREIILSEISYNLNLLNILTNKNDNVEKEIIAKVLKRLKTNAYETVLSTGKTLNIIFNSELNSKVDIQSQGIYDNRAFITFQNCTKQYQLIENLYQKINILKVIGEENLLKAVREKSRIKFAYSLMRLTVDNFKN